MKITGSPSLEFPVIIKPSNSVAYWNCRFPHKRKFFGGKQGRIRRHSRRHLFLQLQRSPDSAGVHSRDESNMRVMNCYCGRDKR